MGTKAKLQCEAHYYNFYYKGKNNYKPKETDVVLFDDKKVDLALNEKNQDLDVKKISFLGQNQGKIPELTSSKENKNRSRSIVKNRNRKDQTTVTSASEIVGYWPKREEFDIEYLNEAELEIAELEFMDDDTESEKQLKLNVLKVYNAELEEREIRKK